MHEQRRRRRQDDGPRRVHRHRIRFLRFLSAFRSSRAFRVCRSSVSRRPRNARSLSRAPLLASRHLWNAKRAMAPLYTRAGGRAGGSPVTQIVRRPDTPGSPEGRGGLRTRGRKIPICAPHVRRHTCDDRESQYMCTLLIIRPSYVFTIRMCVHDRVRRADADSETIVERPPFEIRSPSQSVRPVRDDLVCRHGRLSSDNGKSCVRARVLVTLLDAYFFSYRRSFGRTESVRLWDGKKNDPRQSRPLGLRRAHFFPRDNEMRSRVHSLPENEAILA